MQDSWSTPLWLYVASFEAMVVMRMSGHGSHNQASSGHAHSSYWVAPARAMALEQKASYPRGSGLTVTPLSLSGESVVELGIEMKNASGDPEFDPVKAASLADSNGMSYSTFAWVARPSRGRIRRGVLSFPSLEGRPSVVKLVLGGFRGVDRAFEWSLGA